MAGTFILSLDCEGKWGMADHLTADHHRWLTSSRLRDAYEQLLGLFGEYEIAGTFAFVMALLLSDREQRERNELFQDREIEGKNWLAAFRTAQAEGKMQGWTMPELLELVQSRGDHEVACHGFSHLPLREDMVPANAMRLELTAAEQVAADRGLSLDTFVYPRNLVGRPEMLAEAGFAGYRSRLPSRGGYAGKALGLLAEMNVAEKPQPHALRSLGITAIPSGYFFNWRQGARRLVPPAVTVRRWTGLLRRAEVESGVVHLWLHPHNIISAPGTLDVLKAVLREVAVRRDAGTIDVQTQRTYCRDREALH